ncbi:hypothetical protein [Leptospira licerasiae]|uniref:hypothetical protein n=1 Tax=Leptospira licerasiae TaxID=447106 RepID=UPI0030173F5D
MKFEGLDKFQKQLKDLEKNIKKLGGTHTVPTSELYSPKFMRSNTKHSSIEEMVKSSGSEFKTQNDLDSLSENPEWDSFVSQNSQFSNWEAMQAAAGKEYAEKVYNEAVKKAFK